MYKRINTMRLWNYTKSQTLLATFQMTLLIGVSRQVDTPSVVGMTHSG